MDISLRSQGMDVVTVKESGPVAEGQVVTREALVRRFPYGAEVQPTGGTHFRVYAPKAKEHVEVKLRDARSSWSRSVPLRAEGDGHFSGFIRECGPGMLYAFVIDSLHGPFPDLASRYQPYGPHGASEVIDPLSYAWEDSSWRGTASGGNVLYEMHIGTFTKDGTFAGALEELAELRDLGVTLIEVMPIGDFPGSFGWGYDGVMFFAPYRHYGRPDDFRRFVDRAHGLGMGVILDVVYNHVGPDGSYFNHYYDNFFSTRHQCEWGEALNFDGPGCRAVRDLITSNAEYWIDEFHLDGLRLDATQQIFDDSRPHIISEVTERARRRAPARTIFIVGENEPQHSELARPSSEGGYGLDALWNDDFHHAARVRLTGKHEAYYSDYRGTAQEFLSAAKYGTLYQGQFYSWQGKSRGTPALDLPRHSFVHFIQNHDQVANSARGERIDRLTSRGRLKAMTALLLLGPQTPMLFQGQEFQSSAPFLYFADHEPALAAQVSAGRREFLSQFPSIRDPGVSDSLASPGAFESFAKCKLNFAERESHGSVYQMHKDLLRLRQAIFTPTDGDAFDVAIDGAVLREDAFLLRYVLPDRNDWLLFVNFGTTLRLGVMPEPLLAPPLGSEWAVRWSSDDSAYGGGGVPVLIVDGRWSIPGESSVLLQAVRRGDGE